MRLSQQWSKSLTDNVQEVAISTAKTLGVLVNNGQMPPTEVMVGALRGTIVFWMGCVQDGMRTEALAALRQAVNEEVDNLTRGIANGMVPA